MAKAGPLAGDDFVVRERVRGIHAMYPRKGSATEFVDRFTVQAGCALLTSRIRHETDRPDGVSISLRHANAWR